MNSKRLSVIILLIAVSACVQQKQDQSRQQNDTRATELPGEWYALEEAQLLAAENNKKVVVFAEAVWCQYCTQMKEEVFPEEDVQQITEEYFYPVRVDIESDDTLSFRGQEMTEMEFSQGMQVTGTPTFIFFDDEGEIIAAQPGFIPEEMYVQILEYVGTDAYLEQSFEEFADLDDNSAF